MTRLRDLAPAISDSRKVFFKLLLLSGVKIIITFIMPNLTDQGYLLLFSFCFTLGEIFFLLSAMNSFFEGLFFCGTIYNSLEMVGKINSAKLSTIIFVIIRSVMTLFPEFIYLYINEDIGYVLAEYKGALNIICIVISLFSGIAWLIAIRSFYLTIKKDKHFISTMDLYYREHVLTNKNLFINRKLGFMLSCFFIGSIFLCDLYIDGINYLPDTIGLTLILFSLIYAGNYMKKIKIPLILGSAYLGISIVDWIFIKLFTDKYYSYGISRNMEALTMYRYTIVFSALQSVLLIVFIYLLTKYFIDMVNIYTGTDFESQFASITEKNKRIKSMMIFKCWLFFAFGIIVAVSSLLYTLALYTWPTYWLINLLVIVIWITIVSKLTYDMRKSINNKYL